MMTRMAHQCREIPRVSVDSLVLGRKPLWMRFAAQRPLSSRYSKRGYSLKRNMSMNMNRNMN